MPQEPLRIEDIASPEQDQRVLRLTGPIVINNLFEFQSTIRSNSARRLIINMAAVPYVDSAGIGPDESARMLRIVLDGILR